MENKYLLRTKDPFQVELLISRIKKSSPGSAIRRFSDVDSFLEEACKVSLFDDSKDILVLTDLDSKGSSAIHKSVDSIDPDVPLVLVQKGSIGKTKAYTYLTTMFKVVAPGKKSKGDLVQWSRDFLNAAGVAFDEGVPELVVNSTGLDQYALYNELSKISINKDIELTESTTIEMLGSEDDPNIFKFVEDLTHYRMPQVLDYINNAHQSDYNKAVLAVLRQLELLFKVSAYRSKNMAIDDIADKVRVPSFIIRTKIFTALKFLKTNKILSSIDLFTKLLYKLRSSKQDKRQLVRYYFLKYFRK